MIVFLLDQITPRWEYTFEFVFGLRGVEFELTDDEKYYDKSDSPKCQVPIEIGGLLRSDDIDQGLKYHDQLSKLFFVLTRMEEYNATNLDHHGRFTAQQSWQFKNDCLHQCICDRWAIEFIETIEKVINTNIQVAEPKAEIIPTFDIDNAFAYKFKTGKRKLLSTAKDVLKGDAERRKEKTKVLSGEMNDPYDAYIKIDEITQNFSVRLFWLVGDYGKPDYNISIETIEIQDLIKKLKEKLKLGVHPSYRSNSDEKLLKEEINRLQKVIEGNVSISRQHFLKLNLPSTYQNLIKSEIKEEYSMGFADEVGFRNGTAHPFQWFDLSNNRKTDLVVYPFAYMDGTLNEYLKVSPEGAKTRISELFEEVKNYGGQFSFIWHNETITDYKKWEGWSSVLDYTLTLQA